MSKSDWVVIALNVFALMMAMVGLATQHPDPMSMALVLGVVAVMASSAKLLRRGASTAEPLQKRGRAQADEMDARTVLDIDARLEALERRERESDEAARILQMAARGQQSAPAEPLAAYADPEDGVPERARS